MSAAQAASTMEKTRILIADDHPYIREGVRTVFSADPGFEVVGEASDGAAAIEAARKLGPDLVLMDITMPGLNGIEVTRRLLEEVPGVRVIILSMHASPFYAIDAFRAGATGYVLKDSPPEELVKAVKKVSEGLKYASPAVAEGLINDFVDVLKKDSPADPVDMLTDREREVLRHIAEGETSREVAENLFISLATVKSHRNNIMKKLRVKNKSGLIKAAIRRGIVTP